MQMPYKRYNDGGCAPSTLPRGGIPPCVRFSTGGAEKAWIFFPQSLLYVSGDFHTFGPFPERIGLFQVSGTVYDA